MSGGKALDIEPGVIPSAVTLVEPLLAGRPITAALAKLEWQIILGIGFAVQFYAGLAEHLSDADHVRGAAFTVGGCGFAVGVLLACNKLLSTSRIVLAIVAFAYAAVWFVRIVVVLAGGPCSEEWFGRSESRSCHSSNHEGSRLWNELFTADLLQQALMFFALGFVLVCFEKRYKEYLFFACIINIAAICAKAGVGSTEEGNVNDDVILASFFFFSLQRLRYGIYAGNVGIRKVMKERT